MCQLDPYVYSSRVHETCARVTESKSFVFHFRFDFRNARWKRDQEKEADTYKSWISYSSETVAQRVCVCVACVRAWLALFSSLSASHLSTRTQMHSAWQRKQFGVLTLIPTRVSPPSCLQPIFRKFFSSQSCDLLPQVNRCSNEPANTHTGDAKLCVCCLLILKEENDHQISPFQSFDSFVWFPSRLHSNQN